MQTNAPSQPPHPAAQAAEATAGSRKGLRCVFGFLFAGCLASLGGPAPAELAGNSAPAQANSAALEYVVIVTGGELLAGSVQDAHTPFLARTLRPLGAVCVGAHLVDDLTDDLRHALDGAVRRAPVVLVTGGLGPTLNDITRQTLSDYTAIPLREDPGAVEELARRLGTTRDGVPENIRRQVRVPTKGGFLPNRAGTAVGLVFDASPAVIVALPGPPRELQPMVREALVPWLQARFGLRQPGPAITLRFIGLGQSRVDQVLREQVALPPGVVVASQFEGGRVDFTFSLPRTGSEAFRELGDLEAAVRQRLGANLYATGTVTLEEVALSRLRAKAGKLMVVDAGSQGMLAASLARQASTQALLAGALSAPSEEGLGRLLDVDPAVWGARNPDDSLRLLAERARARTQVDWVLVVGEARGGAEGSVARVHVGLGWVGDRWAQRTLELRGSAESGRANLVNEVLDWLRGLDPDATVR